MVTLDTNNFIRYNCSIIDLYDRSIIASECKKKITSQLAIKTVKKGTKVTAKIKDSLYEHINTLLNYLNANAFRPPLNCGA